MPIIDIYDDPGGSLLKTNFNYSQLPPVIKEGHILTAEERQDVPNRLFALVMSDHGRQIKKFACPDAANTAVSTFYFLENWKELPEEAVKTAAANLIKASEWYDLPVPSCMHKLAFLKRLLPIALLGGGAMYLASRASRNSRRRQLADMGIDPNVSTARSFIDREPMPPTAHRQKYGSSELEPYVDVTYAPTMKEVLASSRTPSNPLQMRTFSDVHEAVALFKEKQAIAHPKAKVNFCRPVVKLAKALGMEQGLPYEMKMYASRKMATPEVLELGLRVRQEILPPEDFTEYVNKVAAVMTSHPDVLAEKIAQVDKSYHLQQFWGKQLPDPWLITRGLEKTGEYRFEENGLQVTGTQLKQLASKGKDRLKKHFSDDFVEGFAAEPITIFKSMPLKQKKLLMNLAKQGEK